MIDDSLETYRDVIVRNFPDLARSRFELATAGWHSIAVDVDDRLIFKFPRHEVAERALRGEAALLAAIRPRTGMPVPDLTIHDGPPIFSRHQKLKGDHLVAAEYDQLPEAARNDLAARLGRFYADLHRIPAATMIAAGARPIEAWLAPETIRAKALPVLPAALARYGAETLDAYEQLGTDPYGTVYGFFDGHGWNMAFDHRRNTLTGMYDFADSGIGPLHQEFIYSNLISPDLTARIVTAYETETGRSLDRRRIDVLSGMHRLTELAELADDPEQAPEMIRYLATWMARRYGA
jgi:Ser/Thr protein kinase RdoA (MazF antagonist)